MDDIIVTDNDEVEIKHFKELAAKLIWVKDLKALKYLRIGVAYCHVSEKVHTRFTWGDRKVGAKPAGRPNEWTFSRFWQCILEVENLIYPTIIDQIHHM